MKHKYLIARSPATQHILIIRYDNYIEAAIHIVETHDAGFITEKDCDAMINRLKADAETEKVT